MSKEDPVSATETSQSSILQESVWHPCHELRLKLQVDSVQQKPCSSNPTIVLYAVLFISSFVFYNALPATLTSPIIAELLYVPLYFYSGWLKLDYMRWAAWNTYAPTSNGATHMDCKDDHH